MREATSPWTLVTSRVALQTMLRGRCECVCALGAGGAVVPPKMLAVIAPSCGVFAALVLFFNFVWYIKGRRTRSGGRRPSLVPVAAPMLATLGALFAWNRWAVAAAATVLLVDPASWVLLRYCGGARSEESDR